ncbi:MAG: glucose-6-phosphate isomerase [Gammaproteobacteria bacterium]|nr:MAG: glucose-6-phosphate isomerase [Gammaproteobacteria bacterium]
MNQLDIPPTSLPAWTELAKLAESISDCRIGSLFDADPNRASRFSVQHEGLFLDYSKNLVDDRVMHSLLALAEQSSLQARTEAMFSGQPINTTENRAVLHTALRGREEDDFRHNDTAVHGLIAEALAKMFEMSERIREGTWLGSTGKVITDVINIGIGGSDLGPRMACEALIQFTHPRITLHFVSSVDGTEILGTLKNLDPETTLVIVSSKGFSTRETLLNTQTTIRWFEEKLNLSRAQTTSHFIAVTAHRENAEAFGIHPSRILGFQDWVGGRYSLWSTIGLAISISIGQNNFEAMLEGARKMDRHFRSAPYDRNMPVIFGLLGIWYNNFLKAETSAVIPYCERLGLLPTYLQQLDMESNGKSTSLSGEALDYATGPIIWGRTGTNGQHAFFQLLHQGTHLVPIDFIAVVNDPLSLPEHHRVLLASMLAQAATLMTGHSGEETPPHKVYPGNKPSNTLLIGELTPANLGALIALYEHKIFVQGCIWNINSFDQWGVELGKKIATSLISENNKGTSHFDPSTNQLFDLINRKTGFFE